MIFLFSRDTQQKQDTIEISKTQITSENNDKLITLKGKIDYCLDKQLKRAVIIAGLKGGFIYDKGEYYFPGTIPTNTYSKKFISNLDLNWNNLQSQTLVHSQAQVYTPGIETTTSLYEHSIKEDIEKFISIEFLKCLEFENINDIYIINQSDYLGVLNPSIDYTNNLVKITDIDSKKNEQIEIVGVNQILIGIVQNTNKKEATVKFDNLQILSTLSADQIQNLSAINLNQSLNINVEINQEDVTAEINFPVKIDNKEFQTLFEKSKVQVKVRLKSLIDISKILLNYKYFTEKSIDYMNETSLSKVINQSTYFKTTSYKDIELRKTIIMDQDEHKKYIYSIIDKDSRILGNPYVFNFGYENIAPIVHFDSINPNFDIDTQNNIINFVTSKNYLIKYSLRDFTDEAQFWDHHTFKFREESYNGFDAKFSLDQYGNFSFIPYKEKLYSYDIYVTDEETTRKHTINFLTGFPDNKNNTAAIKCYRFTHSTDPNKFPVSQDLSGIQQYQTSDNVDHLFALSLYLDPAKNYPSEVGNILEFSKSCVFIPELYSSTAKLYNANTDQLINTQELTYQTGNNFATINLPTQNFPIKVSIEVKDKTDNRLMTEPFNITIYPSNCLGPYESETSTGLSCCNSALVKNAILSGLTGNDNTLKTLYNSAQKTPSSGIIYQKEIYLCFDPSADEILNSEYDYENNVIWQDIKPDITSLFKSTLTLECQGKYPVAELNIKSITTSGGSNYGTIERLKISGITQIDTTFQNIPINIQNINNAQKCEFCEIEYTTSLGIIMNYNNKLYKLSTGLVEQNPTAQVSTLPADASNTFVLCEDQWYGQESSTWLAISGLFQKDGSAKSGYVSKSYCAPSTTECKPKTYTPTSKAITDSSSQCTDKYFDTNTQQVKSQPNTGWTCGSYISSYTSCDCSGPIYSDRICSSGVCPNYPSPACTPCPPPPPPPEPEPEKETTP